MLIYDQFGVIQNLQMSPIHQTSFLVGTFFAVSLQQTSSSPHFNANLVERFKNHFGLQKQIIHHFEAIITENTSFEK
jgi:hypothetical protein